MAKYPTPTKPGFFWAKLIHPYWKSFDWEVVQVVENCIDEDDDEHLGVVVGGISPMQWVPDFVWGPEVIRPEELSKPK